MQFKCESFTDGERIPDSYAFCVPDANTHATFGPNRNPAFSWSDLPAGTNSLILICHDPDVPSKPDDVNQEGRSVPADLPRVDFFHWIMVDIDPASGQIDEGSFSNGVTTNGKSGPAGNAGTRSGVNNYTEWFAGDASMAGDYYGYDGPCPPWNDSLLHHYHFTLYAIDLERCPIDGRFTGPDVIAAIEGHILAQATVTGTFTLNPDLAG